MVNQLHIVKGHSEVMEMFNIQNCNDEMQKSPIPNYCDAYR